MHQYNGSVPTREVTNAGFREAAAAPFHERTMPLLHFNDLVKSILEHPSFPLVFCGTYEASTGNAPIISNIRAQRSLVDASSSCEHLEAFVHQFGISEACKSSNSLEVFMCALMAALNALNSPRSPSIPAPLHDTIRGCGNQQQPMTTEPIAMNPNSISSSGSEPPMVYPRASQFSEIPVPPARTKIDEAAKKYLETWFNARFENPYPTDAEKKKIAKDCNLQLNQINNWFGKFNYWACFYILY